MWLRNALIFTIEVQLQENSKRKSKGSNQDCEGKSQSSIVHAQIYRERGN
jgi:hypothetical protein